MAFFSKGFARHQVRLVLVLEYGVEDLPELAVLVRAPVTFFPCMGVPGLHLDRALASAPGTRPHRASPAHLCWPSNWSANSRSELTAFISSLSPPAVVLTIFPAQTCSVHEVSKLVRLTLVVLVPVYRGTIYVRLQ